MSRLLCYLFVFFLLLILQNCADDSHVRVKRFEYVVAVPYSRVRIQGYNPLIQWIRILGGMSENLRYWG
uniref:Lipoprotein n=1 Tax=Steinernema glaseri TaxID=37863 RepID=A0A1I7ZID8_9BILA